MTNEETKLARRIKGPSQMERVRAARAIIQARNSETLALEGFMAIFHPEVPITKVKELVSDLRDQGKR